MTRRVTDRLRFERDRTVTVLSGKVELGQGLSDALTLICSEELALAPDRIRVCCGDTGVTPDDGLTAGSGSMERAGAAVRAASRAARHELVRRAAKRLGVPENRLQPRSGAIRPRAHAGAAPAPAHGESAGVAQDAPPGAGGGVPKTGPPRPTWAAVDYWDLLQADELGDRRAGRGEPTATAATDAASDHRDAASEAAANRSLATRRQGSWRRVHRVVRGDGNFVHDLRLPGMVHGRVLRPPGYGQRLTGLAADAARAMRGVLAVVVDGSFVAVAAEREEQAAAAHDVLAASARWQRQAESGRSAPPARFGLPSDGRAALCEARAETNPILRRGSPPDTHAATVSATYSRPFLMHAALGPSAAAARLDRCGSLTIWSHTQGPYELRAALAEALRRPAENIRVIHVDGAGCYGHNGADDVALDAALLALAVPERSVLVRWTREDENRWEPFGTAMIVTCGAQLDTAGTILSWRHEVRSHAHGTRPRGTPGHSTLLAAWHRAAPLAPPPPRNGAGLTAGPQRNAEPLYDIPAIDITTRFVPEAPVRVSALRSLGAFANVFAIESFMDELAARGGEDPLAYRLRHLRDDRAIRVLTEAARAADAPANAPEPMPAVPPAPPVTSNAEASLESPADVGAALLGASGASGASGAPGAPMAATGAAAGRDTGVALLGRGMAVARYKNLQSYAAVVCDVAVDPGSGQIRLLSATLAADAGRIIDRDGLANQLEGGFLQAASWTLKEEVRWDRAAIRSTDWDTYPVLRFSEVPPVTVRLVDRPDLPSVGAGEAAQGPTPAAIANAVYAAAGIRLRHTPFTPARVMAALAVAVR